MGGGLIIGKWLWVICLLIKPFEIKGGRNARSQYFHARNKLSFCTKNSSRCTREPKSARVADHDLWKSPTLFFFYRKTKNTAIAPVWAEENQENQYTFVIFRTLCISSHNQIRVPRIFSKKQKTPKSWKFATSNVWSLTENADWDHSRSSNTLCDQKANHMQVISLNFGLRLHTSHSKQLLIRFQFNQKCRKLQVKLP